MGRTEERIARAEAVLESMAPAVFPAGDDKPTNPKDLIATLKAPLDLVPLASAALQSLGHLEGHLKYGKTNWRVKGVKASVYAAACKRHLDKWLEGQWADPENGVPHLGNALACLGIIVDAYYNDKLIDDRPIPLPSGALERLMGDVEAAVAGLRALHRDKNPLHYTHAHPEGERMK